MGAIPIIVGIQSIGVPMIMGGIPMKAPVITGMIAPERIIMDHPLNTAAMAGSVGVDRKGLPVASQLDACKKVICWLKDR